MVCRRPRKFRIDWYYSTLGALGLGLSVDAFAAADRQGIATCECPGWRKRSRIGAVFGRLRSDEPGIGWLIGKAVADWVNADTVCWIAFVLLVAAAERT